MFYNDPLDINADAWTELLTNNDVTTEQDMKILKIVYESPNHEIRASEIVPMTSYTHHGPINLQISRFSKRVIKETRARTPLGKNGKPRWWHVPFLGYEKDGRFPWILRPELVTAFENIFGRCSTKRKTQDLEKSLEEDRTTLIELSLPSESDIKIPIPEPLSIDKARQKKEKTSLKDGENGRSKQIDFDSRNKARATLGARAEFIVYHAETKRLVKAKKPELAKKIDPTISSNPDFGYDILSYNEDGSERKIEVKAVQVTNGCYSFFISENQWQRSQSTKNYFLYFVVNAGETNPKVRFISGKDLNCDYLHPSEYKAFVPFSIVKRTRKNTI